MLRPSPKSPSHRLERVAEAVRHALSELLARGEIVDPLLLHRVVTVAGVRMSPDLKLATVAVMPLGGKDGQKIIKALAQHRRQLRAEVAHRVNLKYAPDLRFVLDESFDSRARIDELLRTPQVARDLEPNPPEERS